MSARPSVSELRAAVRRSLMDAGDSGLLSWLQRERERSSSRAEPIEYVDLRRWSLDRERMAVSHESARFFSIIGAEVELSVGAHSQRFVQPLVTQDEVGLLGLLMRVEAGRAELLVQAKFEPGDPLPVQLAPTLQATRSNYSRAHEGRLPTGLSAFVDAPAHALIVDVEQPEQAEFFLAKRNRNVVVLVDDEPDFVRGERFRWVTLAELGEALMQANLVNMSLRSVLSCLLGLLDASSELGAASGQAEQALNEGVEWTWRMGRAPLDQLRGWTWSAQGLAPEASAATTRAGVCFIAVEASEREVERWTQPMLTRASVEPIDLYVRADAGSWGVLAQLSLGPGQRGGPRLGPTNSPAQLGIAPPTLVAAPAELRFDVELAEDGGRLYALRHRYRIWELGADAFTPPGGWLWLPLSQILQLQGRGLVDVELRSCLLALMLCVVVGGGGAPTDA